MNANIFPLLEKFLAFIEKEGAKTVTKDLWVSAALPLCLNTVTGFLFVWYMIRVAQPSPSDHIFTFQPYYRWQDQTYEFACDINADLSNWSDDGVGYFLH